GGKEIKELFGAAVFDTPKPTKLIRKMLNIATPADEEHIVLDFFAGSSSTGAAVMIQNSEDGGARRFISVQIPEPCGQGTVARQNSFKTIADISMERLRRTAKALVAEKPEMAGDPRLGVRVLK